MTKSRDNNGRFVSTGNKRADMALRRESARNMHGFTRKEDFGDQLLKVTESAMTKIGTKRAERAFNSLSKALTTDYAEIYSPSQNFFDEDATGGDDYAESGRVPINELVAMTQWRVGWANRATRGKAQAIYRNGYEFIEEGADPDSKPKPQKEIRKYFDEVDWFSWRIQHSFREKQTGLGIGVFIYPGEKKEDLQYAPKDGKERPKMFKAYSPWHLTPSQMLQYELGDYNKREWDFRGGIDNTLFHHKRITLLETNPEPFHLRGIAEIEPIWWAAMLYYNLGIFMMKAFANMGTATVGIRSANEIPTKKESDAVLELLDSFRANKFYMLGAGQELVVQNAISKIGGGIQEIYEVLKEDISAALVIPKNQLFGRSEGGGLDGAGALVSKDDMLAELMAEAQDMTSEELALLRGPCKFEKHLEGLTLRWRLDLHKTERERLHEESVRLDMEVKRQMQKQALKQMKINNLLMEEQHKQAKANPRAFLDQMNTEVERNTQGELGNKPEKKPKQLPNKADFLDFTPKTINYSFGSPLDRFRPRRVDEDV